MDKKIKTMDKILCLVGAAIAIFTVIMILLYIFTGGIPDTLCTCFFVACTGECGFMGWIKSAKIRYQEREEKREDEERQKQAIKEAMGDI